MFGRWVESEVQEAESSATNKMFANMYKARTFARCMGDDMSESTAGFADPALSLGTVQPSNRKRRTDVGAEPGDEVLSLDVLAG